MPKHLKNITITPPVNRRKPSPEEREKEKQDLQSEVEKFLQSGGKVQQIGAGVHAEKIELNKTDRIKIMGAPPGIAGKSREGKRGRK